MNALVERYIWHPIGYIGSCVLKMWRDFTSSIGHISIESMGWVGVLFLHAVTVPTMLGLMVGITDNTPPIDMVLILWAGLAMLYVKAIIQRDIINIILIGLGFIGQAFLMALVFFK